MKTTLSWLKTHLATNAPLGALVDRLTMLGHEVERIDDRAAALSGFVVARVISAEPHPNADRLRVCVVDAGDGEVQVVCGAPNARTGMKGVFGPTGVMIPKTGKCSGPRKPARTPPKLGSPCVVVWPTTIGEPKSLEPPTSVT